MMQNNTINNILNDFYVRDYLKYIVFIFTRWGFVLSNCVIKNGSSVFSQRVFDILTCVSWQTMHLPLLQLISSQIECLLFHFVASLLSFSY